MVKGVMLQRYGITIILFDIGYSIIYFFRAIRDSINEQRWYSPDSHIKNEVGQTSHGASLHEC
jgi:hypothetical protein